MISIIRFFGVRLALLALFWACSYGIEPNSSTPWNGLVFGFISIFVLAYLAGLFSSFIRLPPLVGMLLAGIALTNFTSISLNASISSFARNFALGVILLRAGTSLDPAALKRLSWVCLRLAFTPCIVETLVLAVATYLLLGLSFLWCLTLGFVCVATSPAVIVPAMIQIQEQGLGTSKGIPTLIMGGSSIDDVMAITGFEIFLGLLFSSSSSVWSVLAGPMEAIGGLILGTAFGLLFWWLPSPCDPNNRDSMVLGAKIRFSLLLISGIGLIFTTKRLGFESIGPLGTLSMAFTSALRWRHEGFLKLINETLHDLWFFSEVFLFSLIGVEVRFSQLKSKTVIWSLVSLSIGMVARSIASFSVVWGAGLTIKERFFIAMAWLPKGTVQAAIGSIPLELARAKGDENDIQNGLIVLTYAVLSIIITAPLGAFLISLCGPKLLSKTDKPQNNQEIENTNRHV